MATKKPVEKPKKTHNHLTKKDVQVIVDGSMVKTFDKFLEKQTKTNQGIRGLMREMATKNEVIHRQIVGVEEEFKKALDHQNDELAVQTEALLKKSNTQTESRTESMILGLHGDIEKIQKPHHIVWTWMTYILIIVSFFLLAALIRNNKTEFEKATLPIKQSLVSVKEVMGSVVSGLESLRKDFKKSSDESELKLKKSIGDLESGQQKMSEKIDGVSVKMDDLTDLMSETSESVYQVKEKVLGLIEISSNPPVIDSVTKSVDAPVPVLEEEQKDVGVTTDTPIVWDGRLSASGEPVVEQYKRIYTMKFSEYTPWFSSDDIIKGRIVLPKIDGHVYVIIDYNDNNPFTSRKYSDVSLPVIDFVETKEVNMVVVKTLNFPQDVKRVRFYLASPRSDEEPLVVNVLDSRNKR